MQITPLGQPSKHNITTENNTIQITRGTYNTPNTANANNTNAQITKQRYNNNN